MNKKIAIFVVVLCAALISNIYSYPLNTASEDLSLHSSSYGVDKIRQDINAGANVNYRDKYGLTPLMNAARRNNSADVIKLLIRSGARVDARGGKYDMTPLMYAAQYNTNPAIVRALIEGGADINAISGQWDFTPLMYASFSNDNAGVLMALIEAGADVNLRADLGDTALIRFLGNKKLRSGPKAPEVVQAFIDAGIDVNIGMYSNGATALIVALHTIDNLSVIETLVAGGADVNLARTDGYTPLMAAAKKNHNPEIIKYLIEAGADASARDINGNTALDYIRGNASLRNTYAYEILLDEYSYAADLW